MNDIEHLVGGIFNAVTFLSSMQYLMTIKMIHSCIVYQCTSNYDGIYVTHLRMKLIQPRVEVYTCLAVIEFLRNCEMKDLPALTPTSSKVILVSFLRALLY